MKVCRILCLNLFFLILIVHASARTCEERLESLENAVQSLIENERKAVTENVDPDPLFKESSRCPHLRKERNLWKRKLEDLEKSLTESNRQIHELRPGCQNWNSQNSIWKAGGQQRTVVKRTLRII